MRPPPSKVCETPIAKLCKTLIVYKDKDKDNNWLGLSASLLAGEIAFRGYFSKDTTPLGPTRQQQTQVLLLYIGAAAPPLEKCKSSDPNVITILL